MKQQANSINTSLRAITRTFIYFIQITLTV